jgi:hypothetical protein
MASSQGPERTAPRPLESGQFSWFKLVLWLPGVALLGGIAAWVAAGAQAHYNPIVLFAILVGIGLGAMLVGLMRVAEVGHRTTILVGTVLAAAIVVAGPHFVRYRDALRLEHQQFKKFRDIQKAAAEDDLLNLQLTFPDPPADFADYLTHEAAEGWPLVAGYVARGWAAWLCWTVDGLLTLAVTLAMVVFAARQPYCNRCASWYRTLRSGRAQPPTARQLAEVAEVTITESLRWARYRLSNCRSGCGSTRLELSWEDPDGRTLLAVAWPDPAGRDRAMRALDEANAESGK